MLLAKHSMVDVPEVLAPATDTSRSNVPNHLGCSVLPHAFGGGAANGFVDGNREREAEVEAGLAEYSDRIAMEIFVTNDEARA